VGGNYSLEPMARPNHIDYHTVEESIASRSFGEMRMFLQTVSHPPERGRGSCCVDRGGTTERKRPLRRKRVDRGPLEGS